MVILILHALHGGTFFHMHPGVLHPLVTWRFPQPPIR